MPIFETKPNLTDSKFEQCANDIINLSGHTQIYGRLDIESGATLSIVNVANGDAFTQCGLVWDSITGSIKKIPNDYVIYAENGLCKIDKTVYLGGALVKDTTIELNSSELNFYNPAVKFDYSNAFNCTVTSSVNQIDGKILFAGFFTQYSGKTANQIVRLNSDGTYDNSFCACLFTPTPWFGVTANVYDIYLQPDNKIVAAGNFLGYDGACSAGLVRINPDGSRDTDFCTGNIGFNCFGFRVKPQGDGKILIAGQFSCFSGACRQYLARICSDGTLDETLPNSQFNCYTRDIAIQSDKKILVAGYFNCYQGSAACGLVRIDCDGNCDSSFANGIFDGNNYAFGNPFIDMIRLDADENILVAGNYKCYSGISKTGLVRLKPDGYIDNTFDVGTGLFGTTPQNCRSMSLAIQTDGKILVGGIFDSYNGNSSKGLVRVNPDGSYDSTFVVGDGFAHSTGTRDVRMINVQENNKILVGGVFTSYSGLTSNGFIRLNSDGSIDDNNVDHLICFDGVDIKYGDDYSSTFTDRSLVDKAYVLSQVSGGMLNWSGSTANAIGTYVSVSGICAQPNLTFDGSTLNITGKTVTDTLQVETGAADGCVLTSDASGNATWQTPAGGGTITGGTNGLSTSGANITLGGVLTGNTSITGNYSLNVCDGAKLNTTCGYQISGVTILKTANDINSIAIGVTALNGLSTGVHNIAIGYEALCSNDIGNCNIAIGRAALHKNTSGFYNIGIGYEALCSNTTGCYNIASGTQSLHKNLSGCHNIAQGNTALYNNTTGCENIAQGRSALYNNTTGCENIAQGRSALYNNTTGCYNIVLGNLAHYLNISGCDNVVIGGEAMRCTTAAKFNVAIGGRALCALTGNSINNSTNIAIGYESMLSRRNSSRNIGIGEAALCGNISSTAHACENIAIGACSQRFNLSGCHNIALGTQSLECNCDGKSSIAIGSYALRCSTGGTSQIAIGCNSQQAFRCGEGRNVAIGGNSLIDNTSGNYNTAIGAATLSNIVSGNNNTALGYYAGAAVTGSSSCNVFIGYETGCWTTNATVSKSIFIGYQAGRNENGSDKLHIANSQNCTLICGDFAEKTVEIDNKLITTSLQVTGGTLSSGYVLTSDASGNATWQAGGGFDPYSALTSGSTVTWNTSTGLNKTLNTSASFTLSLTNLQNGMSGDLRINVTSGPITITLPSSKLNGSVNNLPVGIYHLTWIYTGSDLDISMAQYV